MTTNVRCLAVCGFTAVACLVVGYFLGVRTASGALGRLQNALLVSDATLDVTRFVGLLTLHREGKADLAADRMEITLDSEIIDLARLYSSQVDREGSAARTLRAAATYRAAHPHHSVLEPQVTAALAPFTSSTP
jgi:hypothetical protein